MKYSFIVDGADKFFHEAAIFLTTLLAYGASRGDVICRYTPTAQDQTLCLVSSFGIELLPMAPFGGDLYCNKIAQLDALIDRGVGDIVLCDTDIAFLDPLTSLLRGNWVRAKVVDGPNPPIAVLDDIRATVAPGRVPRLVPVVGRDADTYSVNCNGGLYIIPGHLAPALASAWRTAAERLIGHPAMVPPWANHRDQISFAMAMLTLGLDVLELPMSYNFPLHHHARLAGYCFEMPRVLHYHDMLDENNMLRPVGNVFVDAAVRSINGMIAAGQGCRRREYASA